ncbi:hypothetical protein JA1_004007 [Spathaspora sp. JA1]|nr:hypothetical protein JA1_004007 [Spathaspora sp. JA1]
MYLTQICDLPEGVEQRGIRPNRASVCVLVLEVEKNVASNSPCAFYVTDFTSNPQTVSATSPDQYELDGVDVPRDQVMKILVFPKHFPSLDRIYKESYGQELDLCSWYSSKSGYSKKYLLPNLLVLTTNIQLKLYEGGLECPSYDYAVVKPTDNTREVQLLFKNIVKELPSSIFLSNLSLAEKAIPSSCLQNVQPESTNILESENLDVPASEESFKNKNFGISLPYQEPEYDTIEDIEHGDHDYVESPERRSQPIVHGTNSIKSPIYKIEQLIQMGDFVDNNIYTVNARIIETSPYDWTLLCGKYYKKRLNKLHTMDPFPLDLELKLIDVDSRIKRLNGTNSLTVYLTGENVMKLLGIEVVEEMYTSVESSDEEYIKCCTKAHKLQLCRKRMMMMQGEVSEVVWTLFNPTVLDL